eukprot:5935759-Pleurochrysis_carterae.AAC.1
MRQARGRSNKKVVKVGIIGTARSFCVCCYADNCIRRPVKQGVAQCLHLAVAAPPRRARSGVLARRRRANS